MNEAERYLREHSQTRYARHNTATSRTERTASISEMGASSERQVAVSCGEAWKLFWTTWGSKGRSSRSEYWWMFGTLFCPTLIFVEFVRPIIKGDVRISESIELLLVVPILFWIVVFFKWLVLAVRRLHDSGRYGIWLFINAVPIVGNLIFIALLLVPSEPKPNRFGPVPNVR